MNILVRISERLYGILVRLYPKRYKQQFGEEMEYVFSESLKDAYEKNREPGILTLWTRTVVDAGKSLIVQHIENQKEGHSMNKNKDIVMNNKVFLWIALGTAAILSIPLIAMQFTREVDWKIGDFLLMGILLFGTGSLFITVARVTPSKYRALLGLGFLGALFITWVHLAVGIVDSWPLAGS